MPLNREKLFELIAPKIDRVYVEQWGEEVCLLGLCARDILRLHSLVPDTKNDRFKQELYSIGLALCDEHGNRLLEDSELDKVFDFDLGAMMALAQRVRMHSDVTQKQVEAEAKNLSADQSVGSPCVSA